MTITRKPDFIIGDPDDPYLLRWWIIPRNRFFNIYLHKFLRSDNDVPHDHPWWSLLIALWGYAEEEVFNSWECREKHIRWGNIVVRSPRHRHRMIIYEPFWTLFITGPVVREWGFWCNDVPIPDARFWRFVHWKAFTKPEAKGQIGRGCD